MRNLCEEKVVDEMSGHHVMGHVVHYFAVAAVDRLESAALERVSIVREDLPVLTVVLEVRHHKEPPAQDHPEHHANDSEVSSPHIHPKSSRGRYRDGHGDG